jgi:hypothetical protein
VILAHAEAQRTQRDSVLSLHPPRLCLNPLICHSRESGNPWVDLSVKWFAQRHEGTKRLLPIFVSSCEPKSYRVRTYQTIDSRFRGNDNFEVLGRVNGCSRRPELGGGNAPLRPPRLCVNPLICHSRESGERSDRQVNPWAELSAKWFAQRHEGIKRLLRVFVSSCEPKTYRARKYQTMGSRFRGNDNFGAFRRVNEYSPRPSVTSVLIYVST